jgi:hypothetical protein
LPTFCGGANELVEFLSHFGGSPLIHIIESKLRARFVGAPMNAASYFTI